ncbi:hypothetical protein ACHAXN_010111 [Cyclotella atomus]
MQFGQEEGTSEGTSARSEKRLSGTSKAVNSPLLFTSLDTAWQSLLHCSGIIALEDIQDVQQKSKEQKMAAAMAGGKGKKKKWSKGKQRDKVDNKVLFTKEQYDRLNSEVPKMKLITVSAVVEKLKISGGLARRALNQLEEEGTIRKVCVCRAQRIYTRSVVEDEE